MSKEYKELLELINQSDREVLDAEWVRQELFAVRTLGGARGFLNLKETGKRYTNDDSSAIAFLIGITDEAPTVAPISVHTGRIDPPDIDIDFEDRRRDEVKSYLRKKWKHVANISAVGKFSSKGLVRDLARVFAIPLDEVNAACKHFTTLEEYYGVDAKVLEKFRNRYPEIGEYAKKFEGRWRQMGMHAAGVVISNRPLEEILPLESRSKVGVKDERFSVTAYDMDDCQKLGLIKFDVLGLAALSVIEDTLQCIEEKIDLDNLPLDDEEVLRQFREAHTVGIFQTEAGPYSNLLKEMGCDEFNDLVASNALIRPGPLTTVKDPYIRRKHGTELIPEENELVLKLTSDTYGLFIYQEQLIQALVEIGGFTWAEADKIRKIIGKKRDPEEFRPYKEKWMDGASEKIGRSKATRLWNDFLKFAGYAFNKSHAAAYSLLSYQTMWLKVHYSIEYMYALLKNENELKQITTFVLEANRLGIKVLLPDVNKSQESFTIEDGAIRFGLSNIKGIGKAACNELIEKRPFESYEDLIGKVEARRVNSRVKHILEQVGAVGDKPDYNSLYELIGIPGEFTDVPPIEVEISPIAEASSGKAHFVHAIVKEIEKTPRYTKVEIEDESGVQAFFSDAEEDVETGRVIVAMIYENNFVGFTYSDELLHKLSKGYDLNRFEELLMGRVFHSESILYNYGIGKIGDDKVLLMPLHIRRFKVKNGQFRGKMMASMIATDGEKYERYVVFPKTYTYVSASLAPFEPVVIKPTNTRDGGNTFSETAFITAQDLKRRKGIDD